MNKTPLSYRIFSLGDAAISIDFGNRIDEMVNNEVIARFDQLLQHPLPGMTEAVPACSSLTVYYDLMMVKKKITGNQTAFEYIHQQLEERLKQPAQKNEIKERLINIPVCYENEFALDIQYLAATKNISVEEIIKTHLSKTYKVYMLGFLPGFAYMGEVDESISISRKPQPINIEAGSVGIAGRQTGIYPLASPGGWQIIGRTPLKLFDATKEEPTLLKAGDRIQFYSITNNEFEKIKTTETQNS